MEMADYLQAKEVLEEIQRASDMLDLLDNCFCGWKPTTIALLKNGDGDFLNTCKYSPVLIKRMREEVYKYKAELEQKFKEL